MTSLIPYKLNVSSARAKRECDGAHCEHNAQNCNGHSGPAANRLEQLQEDTNATLVGQDHTNIRFIYFTEDGEVFTEPLNPREAVADRFAGHDNCSGSAVWWLRPSLVLAMKTELPTLCVMLLRPSSAMSGCENQSNSNPFRIQMSFKASMGIPWRLSWACFCGGEISNCVLCHPCCVAQQPLLQLDHPAYLEHIGCELMWMSDGMLCFGGCH